MKPKSNLEIKDKLELGKKTGLEVPHTKPKIVSKISTTKTITLNFKPDTLFIDGEAKAKLIEQQVTSFDD